MTDLFGAHTEGLFSGMPQPPQPEAVSPEVRDLLEQSIGATIPKPNQEIRLAVDADTAEELQNKQKAENPDPRLEVETTPHWDTERVKDQEDTDPWDVWRRNAGSLGDVLVTESDKTLFLKAAMHDQEVVLPIEMPGGMLVRVRSLGNKTIRALSVAMLKDQEQGVITDASLWATRLQYFSLVLQIVGVGDGERGLLPDTFDLNTKTVNEIAEWLREYSDDLLAPISGPRYALLVQAVRIFEAKLARCKEGLANGDFFAVAGTSF